MPNQGISKEEIYGYHQKTRKFISDQSILRIRCTRKTGRAVDDMETHGGHDGTTD